MREKINEVGSMYMIRNSGIIQYNIFTKAGHYRGGKVYHADKYFVIISGKVVLTLEESGKDVSYNYNSESGVIKIPSGIPNIFYFPTDCLMLEWFPENTRKEEFEKYHQIKK